MITAYNPFDAQMRFQASREAWDADRQDLADLTRRALRLYKGKHMEELRGKLLKMFQSAELRARYETVSIKVNVLRMLVNQVATIGQTPVTVVWDNEPDQTKWNRLATKLMGLHPWDVLIPFAWKDVEVAKNVMVTATWNKRHSHFDFGFYYPHTADVGWADPMNPDYAHPDFFGILNDPDKRSGLYFDMNDRKGYTLDRTGRISGAQDMPTKDGEVVVPWVTLRAAPPRCGYWSDDGLEDLVEGQSSINYLWTMRGNLLHVGSFKVPILSGDWVEKDGTEPHIIYDAGKPIKLPEDIVPTATGAKKIYWDGPDNAENIREIGKSTYDLTMAMAASLGLHESAITSSNEPASGYSVQVNTGPLRVRHRTSRTMAKPQIESMVSMIRDLWDVYNSTDPFSNSGAFSALIGDYWAGTIPRDEVDPDLKLIEAGLVSRKTAIRKYNPGITDAEIDDLVAEWKTQNTGKVGFNG